MVVNRGEILNTINLTVYQVLELHSDTEEQEARIISFDRQTLSAYAKHAKFPRKEF